MPLREKDYRQLRAKAESRLPGHKSSRRPSPQDRADAAVASRRRHEAVKPYLQLRKELGLGGNSKNETSKPSNQ